jgi:hypothetical protein
MIEDLLSEETVKRRGIFRPKEVNRILEANFSGREDYNLHVFQLLGLELWRSGTRFWMVTSSAYWHAILAFAATPATSALKPTSGRERILCCRGRGSLTTPRP